MKPEIKKMWTEALRSGAYRQGREALQGPGGYCCLGVLCDLHAQATGQEWAPPEHKVYDWLYDGKESTLPESVQEWAGLDEANPRDLAALNDEGMPFDSIADLIEEQL